MTEREKDDELLRLAATVQAGIGGAGGDLDELVVERVLAAQRWS